MDREQNVHEIVNAYYGKILKSNKDLKTSSCCIQRSLPEPIMKALELVPDEIKKRFYGCGIIIPFGIKNLNILDLGCGTGQDCYLLSNINGENGNIVGIDMIDEQLAVANKYVDNYMKILKYNRCNLTFIKDYIENIENNNFIKPQSFDLIISNCVINLLPNKDNILKIIWNTLKYGGEFYFSDVYSDRRLSKEITENELLIGECLGGALYIEDFRRLCNKIGFNDIRLLNKNEIQITDKDIKKLVGNVKFYSITYRLFKLNDLEDTCEDYGQIGIYNGNIKEHPNYYNLDNHHQFITNKPLLICSNTASIITNTWLKPYFRVIGDKSVHYGKFICNNNYINDNNNNNNDNNNNNNKSTCC